MTSVIPDSPYNGKFWYIPEIVMLKPSQFEMIYNMFRFKWNGSETFYSYQLASNSNDNLPFMS